ncbi:hypothetical protein A0127_09180 [Thermococcus peptonophilus]|uniref:Uncharacterized protein n=2 Tax=Thermococcus peptonophilus TaxID=53952 RepID=A0A142CX19_9EURY|nr:hypothetical protein A0127_09180 [Thermococcus peptonophilus]
MARLRTLTFAVFLLILLAGQATALSVELGTDEVLIVGGQVFTFDPSQSGDKFLVSVSSHGNEASSVLAFGENITVGNVTYFIGSYDRQNRRLTVHLLGNYTSVRVMKKYDFSVEVIEAFDTYAKVRIKNTGFYPLNDTLSVSSSSQGAFPIPTSTILKEVELNLEPGGEIVFKVPNPGQTLIFSLNERGISKDVSFGTLEPQVEIEDITSGEGVRVKVLNKGEPVNATFSLLYGGNLILESRKVLLPHGIKWVGFSNFINQGAVVVDYGKVIQQTFYFRPALLVLENISRDGELLRVILKNTGESPFRGFVSVTQNGVVVGSPTYSEVSIGPGESVSLTFKIPEEVRYPTILASSDSGTFSFTAEAGASGISVEALSTSIKVPLGGKGSYALVLSGSGRVKLSVEGLPESVGWKFYVGESEVEELNVDGSAQVVLVIDVPSLPRGFSVGEPVRFNVTIRDEKGNPHVIPLEFEAYGLAFLPVYGKNWLAKMNFTAETHFVGIPYRVVAKSLTPPIQFEHYPGEKIAFSYGNYIRSGLDVTLHILSPSGEILHSSSQEKGRPDFVVFNESDFMLMLEGDRFDAVLLVADYLRKPENISFELLPKQFGEGIKTFILNATSLRGKKLALDVTADRPVEVRVYYFTLNREREDFDPLSAGFKGAFRGKGEHVSGEVPLRPYEDFIAISIIGTGNVSLTMTAKEVPVSVSGLGKYSGELTVALLALLLVVVIALERRLG